MQCLVVHTNLYHIQVHLWNPSSPLHAVDVALVLQSLLHLVMPLHIVLPSLLQEVLPLHVVLPRLLPVVLHAIDVDATLVLPSLLRMLLPLHEVLPRLLQMLPLEHLLFLPCEAL